MVQLPPSHPGCKDMITKRLELALDRLQPSDWERFERLASAFLASDFDQLRTVASPSGDEGRDAELFSPEDDPTVVAQYSVAKDWQAKINATVRRIKVTIPKALVLIYVSNKVIGAGADALKKTLRVKHGLALDVRDRNWFLERVLESTGRQKAAEELAQIIVDPYLASVGVGPHVQSVLSKPEAIAAVTYLGLQWKDDAREKGLTRLAFEALVRGALINSDSEHRLPKAAIVDLIKKVLPDHNVAQLRGLIDSALRRLAKHTIKHWPKDDEYCLAHEEVQRLNTFRVEAALAETALQASIRSIATVRLAGRKLPPEDEPEVLRCLRAATDAVLYERSQAFAMAVQSGTLASLANTEFKATLIGEIGKAKLPKIPDIDWIAVLQGAVRDVLTSNDPPIQAYLRALADTYTLLAFLKQTPDVQSVVEKMFSHGMLWLDATVILPLLADTLSIADGESGRFTRMIDAARESGLKLFVTPGVVEEVERHMNKALVCVRLPRGQWEGSVPYLLDRYVESGRGTGSFASWLEHFRGDVRPLQDLAEYLLEQFDIVERSLEAESSAAPIELRHALEQIWHGRFERRRERYGAPLDEMAITRLVSHDVECYAGIVQSRTKEHASPFGYSAWWLTVDKHAFDLKGRLRDLMSGEPPESPVMSADFLVNYLAFGPSRRRLTKETESRLPLLMVLGNATQLTPELMSEAESLRTQLKDLPERVIRRQVRDHLDRARARIGPISHLGMDDADEIVQRYEAMGK